jgi:hypothetical protein
MTIDLLLFTYIFSFLYHCQDFVQTVYMTYLFLPTWPGVLDTTLCDVLFTTSRCISPGTPISSTNKTDRHDITEILMKVA